MKNPPRGMRTCPTPANGRPVLFAHTIVATECQERQRCLYHKCFTCEYQNGRAPAAVTAPSSALPPLPSPSPQRSKEPLNGKVGASG